MALKDFTTNYWALIEASGTRNDSVLTDNLADNNTVTQAAGLFGNAAEFTRANNEYLSLASNARVSHGDIDFSFDGYFYITTLGLGQQLIAKRNTGSNREYEISIQGGVGVNANRLQIEVFNGAGTTVGFKRHSTVLSALIYYYFAVYHSATSNEVGISINAGAYETAATTGAAGTNSVAFQIGNMASGTSSEAFGGRCHGVGNWKNYILTADDLTARWNGGNGLAWPFASDLKLVGNSPLTQSCRLHSKLLGA